MSNKLLSFLIIVLLVLFVGLQSVYRITEVERAVHLRFGELIREDISPGLHLKLPFIDEIKRFNGRILNVDATPERFFTSEQEQLIVDSYAKFRISDVGTYYRATGGIEDTARARLTARINDGLRNEFSVRTQQQVVSGERDELMVKLTNDLNSSMGSVLGVEVLDVRVQKIDLPAEVSDAVYNRMRADREKVARQTRSEGAEESAKIQADAERQRVLIEAEGYRQAEEIRGQGDAEAASIYASAYSKDPEFYSFLRSLQAYQASFAQTNDILLLEPDSQFYRYLQNSEGTE